LVVHTKSITRTVLELTAAGRHLQTNEFDVPIAVMSVQRAVGSVNIDAGPYDVCSDYLISLVSQGKTPSTLD